MHAYIFESFNLPFRSALVLHDAFRHLHPEAREFTYTAANDSSSVRADRWLISDSLLYTNSAASITDLILPDHSGVATSVSPANAPRRRPELPPLMPPIIISNPAFKAFTTAQIRAFLHANPGHIALAPYKRGGNPVHTALSRAASWTNTKCTFKMRGYCFTFQDTRC